MTSEHGAEISAWIRNRRFRMEAVGVGDDQEQRCGKLSNGFDRVVPDPVIDTQLREPAPRGQFEMQLAQRFMPLLLSIKVKLHVR